MSLPPKQEVVGGQRREQRRLGVGLDGAMVHLRAVGWKELKVGTVFEIEVRPTFDQETQEWLDLGHASHNSYGPHLGGTELFGQLLWTEAQARGWNQGYDTQAIGDGAVWVWNLVGQHFYDSRQRVDWYHATEHLQATAQLCYPDNPTAATRWYNGAETDLFQGHAAQIAADLSGRAKGNGSRAQALRTEAGYFDKNQRRMQYLELRQEGYLSARLIVSNSKFKV
jgi:hypothetical protein